METKCRGNRSALNICEFEATAPIDTTTEVQQLDDVDLEEELGIVEVDADLEDRPNRLFSYVNRYDADDGNDESGAATQV